MRRAEPHRLFVVVVSHHWRRPGYRTSRRSGADADPSETMRHLVHTTNVPGSVPCRVIAKLQPRTWRVILGVGLGHLDGGTEADWSEDDLPPDLRRPNAEFFVTRR